MRARFINSLDRLSAYFSANGQRLVNHLIATLYPVTLHCYLATIIFKSRLEIENDRFRNLSSEALRNEINRLQFYKFFNFNTRTLNHVLWW